RVGHGDADPLGGLEHDLVGVADLQRHGVRLLQLGLVADADDLQALGVAVGDALDHVGDQAAGQAVERPAEPLVVAALDDHLAGGLVEADGDLAAIGERQLALGALDLDRRVLERHLHVGRHGHRLATDTGHDDLVFSLDWARLGRGRGGRVAVAAAVNQWILARTSPPTLRVRAWRSLRMPWGVLRIWMPRPPRTGRSSL